LLVFISSFLFALISVLVAFERVIILCPCEGADQLNVPLDTQHVILETNLSRQSVNQTHNNKEKINKTTPT